MFLRSINVQSILVCSPIVGKLGVKIIFGLCGEGALGPNGLRDKPVTSGTLRVS